MRRRGAAGTPKTSVPLEFWHSDFAKVAPTETFSYITATFLYIETTGMWSQSGRDLGVLLGPREPPKGHPEGQQETGHQEHKMGLTACVFYKNGLKL